MTTRRDFFRLLPALPAAALAIAKPDVPEPAPKERFMRVTAGPEKIWLRVYDKDPTKPDAP